MMMIICKFAVANFRTNKSLLLNGLSQKLVCCRIRSFLWHLCREFLIRSLVHEMWARRFQSVRCASPLQIGSLRRTAHLSHTLTLGLCLQCFLRCVSAVPSHDLRHVVATLPGRAFLIASQRLQWRVVSAETSFPSALNSEYVHL